jgi:hypothetical protein
VNTFVNEKFETVLLTTEAINRDPFARAAMRFSGSSRPLLAGVDEKVALASELINYAPEIVYCGSIGAILG